MDLKSREISVRPEQPADKGAVQRVITRSFGEEQGAEILEVLAELRAQNQLDVGLVAEADGAVIGYGALSHAWLDARERLAEVLVLGPVGVAPEGQGGGVGTALLAAALEQAAERGAPAVFLEGSPDYYGARGFRRGSSLGFTPPSVRIPDAAFQVAVLEGHEQWMTGALVYPDAWWRHDLVGLRDPLLAELEERYSGEELGGEDLPPAGQQL